MATAEPLEAPPRPKTTQSRHVVVTACDANIKVKSTTTTCAFAQNVFYEYWQAAQANEESSIDAYGPASKRTYTLKCSARTLVTCRADDGSYVRFSLAAVTAYDADEAAEYACSHDVGRSDTGSCSDGPRQDGPSESSGTGDECDPNYSGACLDPGAIDHDCEDGSGNGPKYTGEVEVIGDDHYGLDGEVGPARFTHDPQRWVTSADHFGYVIEGVVKIDASQASSPSVFQGSAAGVRRLGSRRQCVGPPRLGHSTLPQCRRARSSA